MTLLDPRAYQTVMRDRLARLTSTGAVLGAMFGAISGAFATAAAAFIFELIKDPTRAGAALGWVMLAPISAPIGAFVGFFIGGAAGGLVAVFVRDPHAYTAEALAIRVRLAILIPTGAFALILVSAALETLELAGIAALCVVATFAIGLGQLGAHWMIRAAKR